MINRINRLYEKLNGLLAISKPHMGDVQKAIKEIEDLVESQEFKSGVQDRSIPVALVGKLTQLEDDLKNKLDELQSQKSEKLAQPEVSAPNKEETVEHVDPHNKEAIAVMEKADGLYWRGKWKDAYELYDQVLKLDPNWLRAQEYSAKAKSNYDNNVGIPKTAVPDDIRSDFARAESALSRWELEIAKSFVDKAVIASKRLKLGQWDELSDLALRIDNYLDIHNAFKKALTLPDNQLDEAIEVVSAAYDQSQRPLYKTKLDELELRKTQLIYEEGLKLFKLGRLDEAIRKTNEASLQQPDNSLYSGTTTEFSKVKDLEQEISQLLEDPKLVSAHFLDIEKRFQYVQGVLSKHLDSVKNHIVVKDLQNRFDNQRPLVLSDIKSNISTEQKRYDLATKVDDAEQAHDEATKQLALLAQIGTDQNDVQRLTERKESRQIELDQIRDDISTLLQRLTQKRKFTVKEDCDRAAELLERFPNDPSVKRFQKPLQDRLFQRRLITSGGIVIAVIFLSVLSVLSVKAWNGYVSALTPTATMTFTATSTPTSTPLPTATITPVPSATPLPPRMQVLRDLYAKSGCYEDYRVTGQIPVGGVVTLLQSDREFDNLGRECILVRYQSSKESVVGWVLLVDLGSINQ